MYLLPIWFANRSDQKGGSIMSTLNPYRHFIFYAKNWYQHSDDIITDLKKICDNYMGHNFSDTYSIISLLESTIKNNSKEYSFDKCITDILEKSRKSFFNNEKYSIEESIIRALLLFICMTENQYLKGGSEALGEPDFSILPSDSEPSEALARLAELRKRND